MMSEFSRIVPARESSYFVSASDEEKEHIAKRIGAPYVMYLKAKVILSVTSSKMLEYMEYPLDNPITVDVNFEAKVGKISGYNIEPYDLPITKNVSAIYAHCSLSEEVLDVLSERLGCFVDKYHGDSIDIGEHILQELALAIDEHQ